MSDNPDIVTDEKKYRQGWHGGLPETPCGYGSRISQTRIQRKWIPQTIQKYGIESVADLGAGDLNWIQKTDLGDVKYRAYDLVPRHPSVKRLNILTDPLPEAECYMLLWVLNHFTEDQASTALGRILETRTPWLMMTWEPRMFDFLDLPDIVERVVIRDRGPGDKRGNVELRLHLL